MIVRIDKNVHVQIAEFYAISMALHPTLDEVTVEKKKSRLYEAICALEKYATIYPNARYKQAWIDAGYKEFIAEDFHFAYRIYKIEETGELVAYVIDACHSLLYHNWNKQSSLADVKQQGQAQSVALLDKISVCFI